MRSFDTSRAPSTFRDINVFIWKLQVGGCLIKKAIQWERKNLGGSGSWGLHKWWETESILFQMTSWWTFRLQLTSVLLYSQRFQFWLRHYVWVRATNLFTSSSPTSLWLRGKSWWTWNALLMKCWLVLYLFHVLHNHSGCPLLVPFYSIILNSMYPYLERGLHFSEKNMATVALSLMSGASTTGSSVLGQQPVS